jgi:hypothetical protein
MAASELLSNPFSVINADDFYGLDSFQKGSAFFDSIETTNEHAVIGYELEKTLSKFGSVSRAECKVGDNGHLTHIQELFGISREGDTIHYESNGHTHTISATTPVSMNFWCFNPSILSYFDSYWAEFTNTLKENPKAEYLIPDVANRMIEEKLGAFKVLRTESDWFGITYKEDFEGVQSGVNALIDKGVYPGQLWN